jgi:MFS family permease
LKQKILQIALGNNHFPGAFFIYISIVYLEKLLAIIKITFCKFPMLIKLKKFSANTFSSLKMYNFRLYFIGQTISFSGSWMQGIAQSWLVLQLTHSGTALGIVNALNYFPILFLSPFGGAIIDRFSKRKILYVTQSVSGVLAISLGYLTLSGQVQVWMIYLIAFLTGLINIVDISTRQVFISEMVGEDELKNAITLNSMLMNICRIAGPTIAGVVIFAYGIGQCFIVNGISFLAFILVVFMMRSSELHKSVQKKALGGFLSGFHYILSRTELKVSLLMMAIIGTLTYEFAVSLALLTQKTFHGDARSLAALTASMGIGAILGGLVFAGRKKTTELVLLTAAFLFGFFVILAAVAPNVVAASFLLGIVGFFSLLFMTVGNTTMQLGTPPEMRGRVMVFWTMAYSGSTAVGAPIIGWIGQHVGPRWSLGVGGISAILAAILGLIILHKNGIKVFPTKEGK